VNCFVNVAKIQKIIDKCKEISKDVENTLKYFAVSRKIANFVASNLLINS
jgi:hypothetical protein